MEKNKALKIVIVADWLTNRGGAEHVVEAMAEAFPEAPIYTSVFNAEHFPKIKDRVKTTWLQKLPKKIRKKHQWLLPLLPSAFFWLDLSEYDVILSSASAFAKCVKVKTDQKHVCYCHTPTRYLYHAEKEYYEQYNVPNWMKIPKKLLWKPLMAYLRGQDKRGAAEVTDFVANSDYVGARIKKYYNKESETIYPTANLAPFLDFELTNEKKTYYLAVGRFIPYKKFALLVRAFAINKKPLKLAGIGPELDKCKALARNLGADNISFLGYVDSPALPALYAGAKGFLFPAEEDFGLTPVEAMASGKPVIYYNAGGAKESVGDFGIGFEKQSEKSLNEAIEMLEKANIYQKKLKERAKTFGKDIFITKLREKVKKVAKDLHSGA